MNIASSDAPSFTDSIWKTGKAMASDAGALVGVALTGVAMLPILATFAPILAAMAVADKVNELAQKRLSRVVFGRLDAIEKAADAAGVSREDFKVGVSQKYVYNDLPFYSETSRFSASLKDIDQWREERQGKRRGLWISKASQEEALAEIARRKPGGPS